MHTGRLWGGRILNYLRQAGCAGGTHHGRLSHGRSLQGHYAEGLIDAGKDTYVRQSIVMHLIHGAEKISDQSGTAIAQAL